MNKEELSQVDNLLSFINLSKSEGLLLTKNGDAYILEEHEVTVPTSIDFGSKKKKKINQKFTTIRRGRCLGNIYKKLEDLPLPSTSVVIANAPGRKKFARFSKGDGQTKLPKSTNYLRDNQLDVWLTAISEHPENLVKTVDTQVGPMNIYWFDKEKIAIATNKDGFIRGIVHENGFDVMDLSKDDADTLKEIVEKYRTADGKDTVKVRRRRK